MKKYYLSLCLIFIFFFLLLYPEEVREGAFFGLTLWYQSVVPILFPFMILSSALVSNDSLSLFLNPLFRWLSRKGFINPWILYPLFFGLFCGFPLGASVICNLIEKNRLTKEEGNALLPLVSQASPMFITGYVGTLILKKSLSFPHLLLCLYFPPLSALFLWVFFHGQKKKRPRKFPAAYDFDSSLTQKNSMSPGKEHTIWNSFTVMVTIGIYMMLFSIAVRLGTLLLPKSNLISLLLCSLEFSSGIDTLSRFSFLSEQMRTGLILALTSFGGFCTAFQTASFAKDYGLSMKYYLFLKIFLAFFVFFIYWLLQKNF